MVKNDSDGYIKGGGYGLWLVSIILILIFLTLLSPYFFSKDISLKEILSNYELGNSALDFGNGILTPIIGSLAVLTTFLAFLVQYQANQRQKNDIRRERFERKFYEQLRLQKESMSEVNIFHGAYVGRSAFVKMFEEYKHCYWITYFVYTENFSDNQHISLDDIHEISYQIFFFGIGESTRRVHQKKKNFYPLLDSVATEVKNIQADYNNYLKYLIAKGLNIKDHAFQYQFRTSPRFKYLYRPFDGHVSRLGHYYRHLYHTVKFVANSKVFDKEEEITISKRSFLKVLRGQLSNHEQALLYANSLWGPGKKWWRNEHKQSGRVYYYFLDYHILKNIPLNLCEGMLQPQDKFRVELINRFPGETEKFYDDKLEEAFEWV